MTLHAPGVYLGLPHAAYLRDTAIGSGAIKDLLTSPPEWWFKQPALNTIAPPEVEDRDHFRLGTAIHVAFLEGWDVFEAAYGVMPSKASHPDALDTVRDLQAWLRGHGVPFAASEAKPSLIARVQAFDPGADVLEARQRAFQMSGKLPTSAREWAVIRLLHAVGTGENVPLGIPEGMTLAEAFRGGLSEVSVFWEDDYGIRHRARFDKLHLHATVDLKSISKWQHGDFKRSLLREINLRGYLLQVAHYEEARRQLRRLVAEGHAFGGSEEQRQTLDEIAASETWTWAWVFAKTTGYPAVKAVRLDPDALPYSRAIQDREAALANFLSYREVFGLEPGRIWIDPEPTWTPEEQDWTSAGLAAA